MKLLYLIKQKGKITLLLFALLFIEILGSRSQMENIKDINTSINEIYSDRLIAQIHIFKISENINRQKIFLLSEINTESLIKLINVNFEEINFILNAYGKTKLTKEETIIFEKLKLKIKLLEKLVPIDSSKKKISEIKDLYFQELVDASKILGSLSEIQITRSRDLKQDSYKTVSYSNLINDLNWALSVIIGICILAIVLTSKSIIPKTPRHEQLN